MWTQQRGFYLQYCVLHKLLSIRTDLISCYKDTESRSDNRDGPITWYCT